MTKTINPATLTVSVAQATPLQTIQQQFSLLNMDGRIWLVDRTSIDRVTAQGIAAKLSLSTIQDGAILINRALRAQFPEDESDKLFKNFLTNPDTICDQGIEFNPSGTSKHYLNLWVGPTIEPKLGSWAMISCFILEVICSNDEKCYHYLIRYIAHALQKPSEKPGVLIALLSGQGTGKGTLGKILRMIWSATYLHVHNIDAVTGNFNASLERSFIVFMDEALFSGDRRAADAMKSLVTESVIQINEKHQPARQVASYHRFIAATNAEHFKNTERDDRRDFVLRVSESRKGDHDYWKALNSEIGNGGVQAMAHELLAMDLSDFNVRDKPSTNELLEQKLQSLGAIPRWWHDCLYQGQVEINDEDKVYDMNTIFNAKEWPDFISTLECIDGILNVAGGKLYKKPSAIVMAKSLKELCPSAIHAQKVVNQKRSRGFILPNLAQARADFEVYIGAACSWPEVAE